MLQRILVWDIPTRVFHWLLVLSFTGAFVTAESERYRDIHVVLGYTVLGLLAFRLLWGFIGTRYARFSSFLFKPAEVAAYLSALLKGKARHYVGHNPLGSVAIWLLLGLGIASGVSGVMLYQEIGGDAMEELHEILSNTMLAIVAIHIAGVVVSSVLHRENLVRAMITGFKSAEAGGHAWPTQNDKSSHDRLPLPRPLPKGEGDKVSLRETHVNQGISRSFLWLGVIMLVAVVAFWSNYQAIGVATPGAETTHARHQHDD